jgi:MoaA/NifB/PqqE/SkfB family radical SAM enzyme
MGSVKDTSLENIINSDNMKKLRVGMLSNVKSSVCTKCYEMEDSGLDSHRTRHNEYFKEHFSIVNSTSIDGTIIPNIKFIDVRFSNICNLKCRTCYHELSSSIAAEEGRKIIMIKALPDYDIFEKQYKNIERIYFAGGEPLLMKEHLNLLHTLIDRGFSKNIVLDYNSNITNLEFKGNDFKELWQEFKNVSISASIDAVGERGEYIRHGCVWKTVEENINLLSRYVTVNISLTASILNISSIIDTHRYLVKQKIINDRVTMSIGYVVYPSHYSAKIIPESNRENVLSDIDKYITELKFDPFVKQLHTLSNFLKKGKYNYFLFNKFLIEQIRLDKIRGENIFNSLPEYRPYKYLVQ